MRVLLVEDNELLRGLTVRILRGLGHDVLEANDAPSALALAASDAPIDVLFTDVRLGGGADGVELALEVLTQAPQLRVLLTSGDPASLIGHLLPADRVCALPKPYRKEQVRAALAAVGAPSSAGSP